MQNGLIEQLAAAVLTMGTTRPRMYPTPSCTVRLTSYMITWRKAYSPRWVNTLAVVAENINASRLMLDIATKVAHYRSKEDKCSQRPTAELISSRRLERRTAFDTGRAATGVD